MTQIDVSKLQVGQVYSYKQLCELTGAEYKKGSSQKTHLQGFNEDGFSRFMKLEKVARGKHLIKEIYDEPLPIVNGRLLGNSSVYFKFIELIVLRYLSKKYDDNEVIFSRRKLWLLLGMINENYRKIKKANLIALSGGELITSEDIDSFYLRCNSKLNKILTTALTNLSKRKLVDFEERTVICKLKNGYHTHEVATKEEREKIISLEYDILQEFGCEDTGEIVYKKLAKKYYERVSEIVKSKYKWEYYYKAYSIVFNHKNIERSIPRLEKSLDEAIRELNNQIVNALNKEANTTYNREVKKYNEIFEQAEDNPADLRKLSYVKMPRANYILAQKILANELINISCEDEQPDAMFDITLIKDDLDDEEELDNIFLNNALLSEK